MSVVKINALTVPPEMRETLEKRFAGRAGAVESSDGFEWFELLRPVEGTDTYLVYTRWRDEAAFQAWMEGPMKVAHQGGGPGGDGPGGGGHGRGPGGGPGGGAGGGGEGGGEPPNPAATGSTLWSFEVVQQAAPKHG